ncbi:hypothetical protein [Elongatibacter sediminis]|uniref:DUF11 domain-containing protein n=1 Tax=Elongatibacter sediminis TaxID=3119006 RepID=A0AAW9RDB4_9GAMM
MLPSQSLAGVLDSCGGSISGLDNAPVPLFVSDLPQQISIMIIPQVGLSSLDMDAETLEHALTCANTGSGPGDEVPCASGNDQDATTTTVTPISFVSVNTSGTPVNTPPGGVVECQLDPVTPAVDNGDGTVTFHFDDASEELITQGGCWIEYVGSVDDKGTDINPLRLTQAFQVTGNCDDGSQEGLPGTARGSQAVTLQEPICIPEVEVCVAVDTDDDGSFADEECIDKNIGLNQRIGENGDAKAYKFFVEGDLGSNQDGSSDDLAGCVVVECDENGENCGDPLTDPFGLNSQETLPLDAYMTDGLDECSAQRDTRTYKIMCDTCDGFDIDSMSEPDTASVDCVDCAVQIEKTSTCDQGANYGESCIGWENMDPADYETGYRYVISNTGDVDLGSCTLDDTLVNINMQGITPLDVGESTTVYFPAGGSTFAECLNVDGNNLAIADCLCLPTVDGQPLTIEDGEVDYRVGENDSGVTFGICDTNDQDDAAIECQSVDLGISKICAEQDLEGDNAVTVTINNDGTAPLNNCSVTDTLTALDCEGGIDEADFDLAPGAEINCTGTVSDLTTNTLNEVSVTCDIGTTEKQVSADADDMCEVPGDCITRTPGFWKNHGHVALEFMPVDVCGVTHTSVESFNTSGPLPAGEGSTVEDMCVSGKEAKDHEPPTSMTQLQLYRQCTAAALNLSASRAGGGSCDREHIERFSECCGFVEGDSLCGNAPTEAEINASGCIGDLDDFNNSEDSLDPFGPFVNPGPASSQECRIAGKNGELNDRDHGPRSGGGPKSVAGKSDAAE